MMQKFLGLFFCILLVGCGHTPQPQQPLGSNPNFAWPVHRGRITQGFKTHPKKHQGLDIASAINTPVYAAQSGSVIYKGRDFTGYGNLIIIEHGSDRWATFYAHLNAFKVREGQQVRKGELIGLMGRTGRATGVHLHFEIRHNLRPVDPRPYLGTHRNHQLTRR